MSRVRGQAHGHPFSPVRVGISRSPTPGPFSSARRRAPSVGRPSPPRSVLDVACARRLLSSICTATHALQGNACGARAWRLWWVHLLSLTESSIPSVGLEGPVETLPMMWSVLSAFSAAVENLAYRQRVLRGRVHPAPGRLWRDLRGRVHHPPGRHGPFLRCGLPCCEQKVPRPPSFCHAPLA